MLDIHCPHCNSRQPLCPSKISPDEIFLNPKLEVYGAITGMIECSICKKEMHFDIYPPHTKNIFGISLEVYKEKKW